MTSAIDINPAISAPSSSVPAGKDEDITTLPLDPTSPFGTIQPLARLELAPEAVPNELRKVEGESSSQPSAGDVPPPPAFPWPIPSSSSAPSSPIVRGKWFDRVMIINLENTDYRDALKNPILSKLHCQKSNTPDYVGGVLCTKFYALKHPSQPNYIAQICGDVIVKDDEKYDITASNIVDLLEEGGVSWGAYMEGYPDGLLPNQVCLDEVCG
ncbi:hypothetical protein HDU67_005089, partial [Dinochytrium kinnereticum]